MGTSEGGRAAWEEWAQRELGTHGERQMAAVDAATAALDSGLSPQAAAIAARVRVGAPVPAPQVRALWDEIQIVDRLAGDLGTIRPSGDLTAAGLAQLVQLYRVRQQALRDLSARIVGTSPAVATAAQPLPQAGIPNPVAPAPPGPSLREFFADNSILVISIAGAFLLIVALLLFEIYGSSGLGGEVRFTGVLILNLIFGAASYLCFGRPRLRLVGQTYLAIFALMVPLTIAAAWVFLALEGRGVSRELASGLGGLSCSILYAILASRLPSRGYAALSQIALAVGWTGLLLAAHAGAWVGPWLTALIFVYAALAFPPPGPGGRLVSFTRTAEPFIHAAAVFALLWSAAQSISEFANTFNASHLSLQLPTTLGLLTLAYAFYCWRSRRGWMLWTVWAGASTTVLAINEPLHLGQQGYVVELVLLAWVYAIGARWMPSRPLRAFVRVGAAVQAALPVLFSASPDGLMAVSLLAAAAVGIVFALEDRRPAWLLLAVGILAVDWFWLGKALLPPPPPPAFDAVVRLYTPLPAIYALGGIALRLSGRPGWSWPLYVGGAVIGLGVAVNAVSQSDLTLAGRALAAYAGLAYVAAAIDRWWPGIAAALVAAATAVILLLASRSTASYWYPAAASLLAILIYAGHVAWRQPDLARTHRATGLAMAGLTAATSFAVPDFWDRAGVGSITALGSLIVAATLLFADGRLFRRPLFDYASAVIASLGGFWIARYLGVANIQASVVLPGVVLTAVGLVAPHDARRPTSRVASRAAVVTGAIALMGASGFQSVTENSAAFYTTLWVIEAVAALLVGIGARSRTLVLTGGAGLAIGALRALFLILQVVQVYVVFGVVAILLLVGAGVLAATRDRLAAARTVVLDSWDEWT